MPEFSIYKSEHSVRIENTLLKQKMRELEAENARLRAKAGEAPIEVSSMSQEESNQTFKAGNCTVSIGSGPGLSTGQASVNPARTPRPPQRTQQPAQRRAQQQRQADRYTYSDEVNGGYDDQQEQRAQPAMVGSQPAARRVDNGDETVMRFSMIELD